MTVSKTLGAGKPYNPFVDYTEQIAEIDNDITHESLEQFLTMQCVYLHYVCGLPIESKKSNSVSKIMNIQPWNLHKYYNDKTLLIKACQTFAVPANVTEKITIISF